MLSPQPFVGIKDMRRHLELQSRCSTWFTFLNGHLGKRISTKLRELSCLHAFRHFSCSSCYLAFCILRVSLAFILPSSFKLPLFSMAPKRKSALFTVHGLIPSPCLLRSTIRLFTSHKGLFLGSSVKGLFK